MRIVGITGLRGSGKSTVAAHLCAKYGWHEMSFAEPLKLGIQRMFGLEDRQVFGPDHEKEAPDPFWGVAPRALMQVIGTELFRDRLPELLPALKGPGGESVWIRAAEKRLRALELSASHHAPGVVFSDVRFPDEAAFIRRFGGEIWHVDRPGRDDAQWTSHPSERMAKDADFAPDLVLRNVSTMEDLCRDVDRALLPHP